MRADQQYLVVGAVLLAGLLVVAAGMGMARLLRPQVPSAQQRLSYESGVDPVGVGWAQQQIRYYRYAFLYVVFAVDAVYLLPWATVLRSLGWATLVEMGIFLGLMALGLLHAVRRGALRWD